MKLRLIQDKHRIGHPNADRLVLYATVIIQYIFIMIGTGTYSDFQLVVGNGNALVVAADDWEFKLVLCTQACMTQNAVRLSHCVHDVHAAQVFHGHLPFRIQLQRTFG